jgi:hypothetical protein
MPRTPLDPQIDSGLRSMPPHEAISTALKLSASLAAGVALLGLGGNIAGPVNRSFDAIRDLIVKQGSSAPISIDELIALVEQICFQIWSLSAFQPDPLKSRLQELVEPICGPPTTLLRQR